MAINFTGPGFFPSQLPATGGGDVVVRVTATAAQAERVLRTFDLRMGQTANVANHLDLQFRKLDRIWAIIAAGSALALVGKFGSMIAEMQKLQIQIGTFEQGMQKVPRILDEVIKLTSRVPFTLGSMSRAFVRLKASGLDPIVDAQGNGPLKDLSDAVAAFGGGDEIFQRATIAIQQMAGKGVISMEELRQQLGEAVPLAMRLMAQELDISVSSLIDRVSRGNLEFQEGIDAFFDGARRSFGGASDLLVNTISGQVLAFQKIWEGLALRIERSGIGVVMTAVMKSFNEQLTEVINRIEILDPDDIIAYFGRIAPELDRAIDVMRNFLSILGSIGSIVASVITSLPPELVAGGLIGFIFAGRSGAVVGAAIASLGTIAPEFAKMFADIESSLPEGVLEVGIIALFFFGKKNALKGVLGAGVLTSIKRAHDELLNRMTALIGTVQDTVPDGVMGLIIWGPGKTTQAGDDLRSNLENFRARFEENLLKIENFQKNKKPLMDVIFGERPEEEAAEIGKRVGTQFSQNVFGEVAKKVAEIGSAQDSVFGNQQGIDNRGGLTPQQEQLVTGIGRFIEGLEQQADSVGSQIRKIRAKTAFEVGKITTIIDDLRKRMVGSSGQTRVGFEAEIAALQKMKADALQLTDVIVNKLAGEAFGKFAIQAERLGKSLDQFLVGEGVGAIDAVDAAVARVDNRFAGWQLRIDQLTQTIKSKTNATGDEIAALAILEELQEKLNQGRERAIGIAKRVATAQQELNLRRAEAALNIAVLEVNEIGLINTLDKAAIAANKAMIQIVRLEDSINAQIAKLQRDLEKGALDPERTAELIERYKLLLKQIADSSDEFVERARFNASSWGILMNTIADSMETAFARTFESIINRTGTAREILLDFYSAITQAAIRYLIEQAKVAAFGQAGAGGGGGSLLSSILGLALSAFGGGGIPNLGVGSPAGGLDIFIPGNAAGGRPPVGQVTRVGEAGEELFVPDVPGTIIPNGRIGGGGINIYINAVDAAGVRDLFVREGSALVESLQGQARLGNFPNENG